MRAFIWIALFFFPLFVTQNVFAQETLHFPNACAKGPTLNVAFVGDVLLHRPLQAKAAQTGYKSLWQTAVPYLQQADIAYANLEGPIAPGLTNSGKMIADASRNNWQVYSDYPLFNYHPSLAKDLLTSGIDIVSTANNHALDRQGVGVDKTIQALQVAGLQFTGTRTKDSKDSFVTITNKNNFKIAWIACTEHTNGNVDKHKQVLYCYKEHDKAWLLRTIAALKYKVDAIIVTPHFGEEYTHQPNAAQKQFAHQVLNAGALIVIGSHPHVLQPMEEFKTLDGRDTFIMYSMGNFVSNQATPDKRTTILLLIGLTKVANQTVINGVKYVPLHMQNQIETAKIKLQRVGAQDQSFYQVISQVLPTGNILSHGSITPIADCQ